MYSVVLVCCSILLKLVLVTSVEQEGRFVVGFGGSRGNSKRGQIIKSLVDKSKNPLFPGFHAKNIRQFNIGRAFDGFVVDASSEAIQQLLANDIISFVEEDVKVNKTAYNWGIDRVDQDSLPLDGAYIPPPQLDGKDQTIYILDTGIQIAHDEFKNVELGENFVAGESHQDLDGHGTHVASSAAGQTVGVAPEATLVSVKVLDQNGDGFMSDVVLGVNWASEDCKSRPGGCVISMSLSGGATTFVNNALNAVDNAVLVAAAGNEAGDDACDSSPASAASVFTVGSSTQADDVALHSNLGTCVDIFGPGELITGAWFASNDLFAQATGTSMATPHAAGATALLLQHYGGKSADPADVKRELSRLAVSGTLSGTLSGAPNKLLQTPDSAYLAAFLYSHLSFPAASITAAATASSTIAVADDGLECELQHVAVAVDVEHPAMGDLSISLVHDGVTVLLFNKLGGSTDDLHAVLADDFSSTVFTAPDAEHDKYSAHAPAAPLDAALATRTCYGAWELRVTADSGAPSGTLVKWALFYDGAILSAAPTSAPPSAAPTTVPTLSVDTYRGQFQIKKAVKLFGVDASLPATSRIDVDASEVPEGYSRRIKRIAVAATVFSQKFWHLYIRFQPLSGNTIYLAAASGLDSAPSGLHDVLFDDSFGVPIADYDGSRRGYRPFMTLDPTFFLYDVTATLNADDAFFISVEDFMGVFSDGRLDGWEVLLELEKEQPADLFFYALVGGGTLVALLALSYCVNRSGSGGSHERLSTANPLQAQQQLNVNVARAVKHIQYDPERPEDEIPVAVAVHINHLRP